MGRSSCYVRLPPGYAVLTPSLSIVEIHVLVEHHGAVVVPDDVVPAEPVAVLVGRVDTLGARIALYGEGRLADLFGLKAAVGTDSQCYFGFGAVHRIVFSDSCEGRQSVFGLWDRVRQ